MIVCQNYIHTISVSLSAHTKRVNVITYMSSLQEFRAASESLRQVMAGFSIPDKHFFAENLESIVTTFLRTLKDPSLPLLEIKVPWVPLAQVTHVFLSTGIDVQYLGTYPCPS